MSRGRPPVEWRDVPGYGGRYQASRDGRVRRVFAHSTRILKPFTQGRRRGLFVKLIRPGGGATMRSVLSVVADAWYGGAPEGMVIAHRNGCHADNDVDNVMLLTREETGRRFGVWAARRPVAKIDRDGGVLEVYSSARAAGKANYLSYQSVIDRCNGRIQKPYLPDGTTFAWDDTMEYGDREQGTGTSSARKNSPVDCF